MFTNNKSSIVLSALAGSIFAYILVTKDKGAVGIAIVFVCISLFAVLNYKEDIGIILQRAFFFVVMTSWFNWRTTFLSFTELMMGAVFFMFVLKQISSHANIRINRHQKRLLFFSCLYVGGGLLCSLYNNIPIGVWVGACLLPFFLLYISIVLIKSLKEAKTAEFAAKISLYGFAGFTVFAFLTGHAEQIPFHQARGQFTAIVEFGGIKYMGWANWLGAAVAMAFPMLFLKYLTENKMRFVQGNYLLLLTCIFLAYRTGTRGCAIGVVTSSTIIFLLSYHKGLFKTNNRLLYLIVPIAIIVSYSAITVNPVVELKFRLMLESFGDATLHRQNLLFTAYENLLSNPIGNGFSSEWDQYSIDESNFFTWSANGVGLIGVIGFVGMLITLLHSFIRGLGQSDSKLRYYSILGIGVLVATIFGANSSDQILHQAQTLMPFWLIMGTCFQMSQSGNNNGLEF